MDFIGPLPMDQGHDCILTITDRLGSEIRIIPTSTSLNAKELAVIFFDHWYCENGLPNDIISDRDKLFMSSFWKHLNVITGIKHKASSSYHPESNGASERTNKTVNQCLRFHVERNQKGWVRALPRIRFQIMNTINKSTNYTPFQLRFGRSPRIIPPLLPPPPNPSNDNITAREIIQNIQIDVADARDNLLLSKISQAFYSNSESSRKNVFTYNIGDKVMLSTLNRRRDYKLKGHKRAAKFMPRFDGPYIVVDTHLEASTITLDMPNAPNLFPTFHTSHVKPWNSNDDSKFPSRTVEKPGPIDVDGVEEFLVDSIIDHKKNRKRLSISCSLQRLWPRRRSLDFRPRNGEQRGSRNLLEKKPSRFQNTEYKRQRSTTPHNSPPLSSNKLTYTLQITNRSPLATKPSSTATSGWVVLFKILFLFLISLSYFLPFLFSSSWVGESVRLSPYIC